MAMQADSARPVAAQIIARLRATSRTLMQVTDYFIAGSPARSVASQRQAQVQQKFSNYQFNAVS
jgi:hypothetical protein